MEKRESEGRERDSLTGRKEGRKEASRAIRDRKSNQLGKDRDIPEKRAG